MQVLLSLAGVWSGDVVGERAVWVQMIRDGMRLTYGVTMGQTYAQNFLEEDSVPNFNLWKENMMWIRKSISECICSLFKVCDLGQDSVP